MSVIYCGKSNTVPYYIKEADLNVYSIQELAYFVYNYPMLISNNFVNKNLILYIYTELGIKDLSTEMNDLYICCKYFFDKYDINITKNIFIDINV